MEKSERNCAVLFTIREKNKYSSREKKKRKLEKKWKIICAMDNFLELFFAWIERDKNFFEREITKLPER